jgi:hypothetical protein
MKSTKNISQDSWYPWWSSNTAPAGYKPGLLPLACEIWYHVTIYEIENQLFLEERLNNFPWLLSPWMAEFIYGLFNDAVSSAGNIAPEMTIGEQWIVKAVSLKLYTIQQQDQQ